MDKAQTASLTGQLLIAMPGIGDPRFERTVIYLCSHSDEGSMGLVVNRPAEGVNFEQLLSQLDIDLTPEARRATVRFGGPVEMGRGFVLHSGDYHATDSTMAVADGLCLTATLDVLRAMANGNGPEKALIALGYSGWAPNQLEQELQRNGWLICGADDEILFAENDDDKWLRALRKLGIDPLLLSTTGGSA